ncbi:hypothetical protein [Xanthomonas sp. NCPPB 2632]|uniref:hypothetical protein n=1 Tax=Xanthomonas sp. NCPPB 2632 TaxID=3240912 RepID=UPI003518F2F6
MFWVIVTLWPVIAGFIGAWLGRLTYDFMFAYVSRTPGWRRFDRSVARLLRRSA